VFRFARPLSRNPFPLPVHPEPVEGFAWYEPFDRLRANGGSAQRRTGEVALRGRTVSVTPSTKHLGSDQNSGRPLSEANFTSTKFCSDPNCGLPGANKIAKVVRASTETRASHSICQGERWERVDCKLQQRRGAYLVSLHQSRVCFAEVCRRHVPSPVHAKQSTQALLRAFISVTRPSQTTPQKQCCGLFKT
jgi:hypothetical protein